jgi:hypothetical protein
VEYAMMAENDAGALHADVLKIGHHGSKNSSMPESLAAVGAQLGIISAGEQNPYGHPSPVLLQRLEQSGMRVFHAKMAPGFDPLRKKQEDAPRQEPNERKAAGSSLCYRDEMRRLFPYFAKEFGSG